MWMQFDQRLNEIYPGLAGNLELIVDLDKSAQQTVLSFLLELACESTHEANLTLGRESIWSLPRDWLLANIEEAAEPLIQINDEWEYRRLIEVYWHIDIQLVKQLAQRGLNNSDYGIHEAAEDWLETLTKWGLNDHQGAPGFNYWERGPT